MPVSTIDPRTALVVVDVQRRILAAPLAPHSAADVVARSIALAEAFRSRGLPVILLRDVASPQDATSTRIDARRPAPAPADATTATPAPAPAKVSPEVRAGELLVEGLATDDDLVIDKHTWGGFHGTGLDLRLRRRGITQVVLTGVATSLGVESTARAAHEHGYHVTLAVDALTDIDPEAHRNSVERIFPKMAESATTAELIALLP
ncbi:MULTISPECIES: isochorismatase family protein [Actinoplanes]|uniref:isochorismatase family protein n=1 Tax=Actinoplanes TaxID=1865 RepID=UPI0005F2F743|nr:MULTISPECIES: isochorismatase family protein [Actinoplanes]GLY07535.1 hydrolase [Actinoplanes sp. NBRC 101535]